MDLEIKHFQLVAAIARTGSVTRAGDLLNLSQSALSHQLRDIEDRLTTPLFHRVGKRMVLTTAGDAVLRAATQVLDIVGRTEDDIRKAGKSSAGLLRITTQCYTCYHWLPGLLKEYPSAPSERRGSRGCRSDAPAHQVARRRTHRSRRS